MPKLLDYSKKECLGKINWFETRDWNLNYAGDVQVGDILSIPTPTLEAYGWYKIIHDLVAEIPVIKKEYHTDGRKGWNYDRYWLVEIDFSYFMERQLRDMVSLKVDESDIPTLHSEFLSWTKDRLNKRKQTQLLKDAESLAEQLGISVESLLSQINSPVLNSQTQTVIVRDNEQIILSDTTEETTEYLKGKFMMLGNECFLERDAGNGTIERYKFDPKTVLAKLLFTEVVDNPKQLLGTTYKFIADTETPCKSVRKPKGWVKEIVW